MISMVTPAIISAIVGEELAVFAVILLIGLLSAAEIIGAEPEIKRRFNPFMETYNAIVIPLLVVFALIVLTRIVMIL